MKIYSRITINNTKKATLETQNLLSEFYKKSSCYLINKDIQLFSIPTDAEEYNYIRKLKLLAPREVYFSEFFEKNMINKIILMLLHMLSTLRICHMVMVIKVQQIILRNVVNVGICS